MTQAATPQSPSPASPTFPGKLWLLLPVVLAVTALTEWIGPFSVPIWSARIVILPMLVALLLTNLLAARPASLPSASWGPAERREGKEVVGTRQRRGRH